ncbi:MAG TPA: excinuclease ABC subunit UvrA [Rhodothermales bacterium]|nr:excinuclease ABC subunit UvrA [Rhodothermales bacterium]
MPTTTTRKIQSSQSPAGALATNEAKRTARKNIVIRGARQHNLKSIDVDLPRNKLIVFTGPSGSGKSSLAFDTIYAEGQRRYVESLSSYARQFLERMDKPDADLITGLAPAIAIEQKTTSKNPRSTVATQTEIYDHLRLLYARIGRTVSPISGEEVTRDSPRSVSDKVHSLLADGSRFFVCFPVPEHKGKSLKNELETLRQRGFFRVLLLPTERQEAEGEAEEVFDLNETPPNKVNNYARERLLVLVDRLAVKHGDETNAPRVADSVEQTFKEGAGRCVIRIRGGGTLKFSEYFERDGIRFEEPTPLLFSFNSPFGACPTCQGFGRVAGLDENLIIPNPDLSIRQGAVAPFRTEQWSKYFRDLIRLAADRRINIDLPYSELSDDVHRMIWDGQDNFVGINGFFAFLEKHNYKMHYRIYHARFRGYSTCPDCKGHRVRIEARYVKVGGLQIGEVCELTTRDAQTFFDELRLTDYEKKVAGRVLEEVRKRLKYLVDIGLDYLSLDRLSQTLSGGESQRINLSTSLGSSLVGSLYVLDEPSIGLHPRDNGRLINILEHLRDIGNTVLVVEHEAAMMERADQIVDMGPGAGRLGGNVVFQGTYDEIIKDEASLTGAYLSGREAIPVPVKRRTIDDDYVLVIENARQHNLKRVNVQLPLGMITCVTGVSGSGKSTLIHDTLSNGLARLKGQSVDASIGAHDAIRGHMLIDQIEMVDQSPIGKTPRSNPATYTKAFDHIRDLFSNTYQSRLRALKPGYFSFNVPGGRCEVCTGEGVVKVEMQFLADLYLECEGCKGRRYKQDVLEITYAGKNIDDVLKMTVDEAVEFFAGETGLINKLTILQDIGLGYLTLGQPSNTLSGGESQRLKLASYLGKSSRDRVLYLLDEPTTGLHFDDIKKLMSALNALVEDGHSVILVEHNLDVIKCADWVIDLGPEGGRKGGFIVAEGTPEDVAAHPDSHTGRYLRDVL